MAASSRAVRRGRLASSARLRTREEAADSTVLPQTLASIRATESSGRQRKTQTSWNVPLLPETARGSPQSMPTRRRRCRSSLQGNGGCVGGDFAQLLTDLEFVPDQGQLLRLAPAQRRQGGLT